MNLNLLREKFDTPRHKLAFVLSYILILSVFDSYTYGIVYQQKMANNHAYVNKFTVWLFEEQKTSSSGIFDVPNYRMMQKTLEISGLLAVFYFCGSLPALGILLSHYFMSYDLLFYIILKQTQVFRYYEINNNTYWLQHWFQSGYFMLKPFDRISFYTSGLAGIALAITFCFAKVNRKGSPNHILHRLN